MSALFTEKAIDEINEKTIDAIKKFFEEKVANQWGIKNIYFNKSNGNIEITFIEGVNVDLSRQDILKTLIDGGAVRKDKEDEVDYFVFNGSGRRV